MVVLGSLNMDIIVSVDRTPEIGETIEGNNVTYLPGGKGANQAVGLQQLAGLVDMVGVVGDDMFGRKIIQQLSDYKVNTSHIDVNPSLPTGIANIVHLPWDNSIIIVPGANQNCSPHFLRKVEEVVAQADLLLMQLEIPTETVETALTIAKRNDVKTILNPAPAKQLSDDLLKLVDYITPNETELATLLGIRIETKKDLEAAFERWKARYSSELVVTLGEKGCAYWKDNHLHIAPSKQIGELVDTTGAGDAFNAAFAYGVTRGWDMERNINFAVTASGLAVTKFGAQAGMPTLKEVEAHVDRT